MANDSLFWFDLYIYIYLLYCWQKLPFLTADENTADIKYPQPDNILNTWWYMFGFIVYINLNHDTADCELHMTSRYPLTTEVLYFHMYKIRLIFRDTLSLSLKCASRTTAIIVADKPV